MVDVSVPDVQLPLECGWVEPEIKTAPPNHLLDTEIFFKLHGNRFVRAEPTELHFHIVAQEKDIPLSYKKRLWLINIAAKSTRVNFIPPQTKWFNLFFSTPQPFVPGSRIACTVIFKPDEAKYYEDAIRVHTEDKGNNLLIPLYGYPVAEGLSFPEFIRLPPVPLGQSLTHSVPLKCKSKVDFQYVVKKRRDHPSFEVGPNEGLLRNGEVSNIHIRFTPTDYTTCRIDLELSISQIHFQPKRCSIIGCSQPGLNAQQLMQEFGAQHGLDARDAALFALHPLDRARQSKTKRESGTSFLKPKLIKAKAQQQNMQKEGAITCPYHVAQLLCNDYRSSIGENLTYKRRQQKALEFEALIRQDAMEERRNQVRWHSKLGQQPVSTEMRVAIRTEWEAAWQNHLDQCSDLENLLRKPRVNHIKMINLKKHETFAQQQRPRRPVGVSLDVDLKPTFRTHRILIDGWTQRWDQLSRFRQVIAKVIIRQRMMSRLKQIRRAIASEELKGALGNFPEDVSVPEDISVKIGCALSHKPLGLTDRAMPKCWTERHVLSMAENKETESTSNSPLKQIAIDSIEMTTNMVVPPHNWPVFNLPPPWEWKLAGCQAFDPLEARDLAVLINDPATSDVKWVVSFLESRLDLGQREPKTTTSEDKLTYITPTDKRFPVGDPMSLSGSILRPARAGQSTEFPGAAPPITVLASPQNYPDSLRMYVEEIMQSPDNVNDIIQDAGSIESTDDLKSVRTILEWKNTAKILTDWTTNSDIYVPLVPISPYPEVEEDAETRNETVTPFSEPEAVKSQLCDYRVGADVIENNVAQIMEEFMTRFSNSIGILRPWIPSQNLTITEKDAQDRIAEVMLNKSPVETEPLKNYNQNEHSKDDKTYQAFVQAANDIQEDIMSLCTGTTSGALLSG